MAFAKGSESKEPISGGSFKKYVGAATVKVLAFNPNIAEWNKITGGTGTEERVYIGDKDGVKYSKLTFLVQIDPEKSVDHSDGIVPITFWLRKQAIKGQTSGKIKIIDKYGQTAWATEEDIAAKKVPEYSNGPANIDTDYRKCVAGEEELTLFLKALMNIPNPRIYNKTTGAYEPNPNLSECGARFDSVMKFFDGDFNEIKAIIKAFPNNKVRLMFGIKRNEDKEYQDFFTQYFQRSNNNNNVQFQKELSKQTEVGRYPSTYFGEEDAMGNVAVTDVREYVVGSTTYTDSTAAAPKANTDPFDNIPTVTEQAAPAAGGDNDLPF